MPRALLKASAVKSTPDGGEAMNTGKLNNAATPKAFPNPEAPEPATVCTRAEDKSMERMRSKGRVTATHSERVL